MRWTGSVWVCCAVLSLGSGLVGCEFHEDTHNEDWWDGYESGWNDAQTDAPWGDRGRGRGADGAVMPEPPEDPLWCGSDADCPVGCICEAESCIEVPIDWCERAQDDDRAGT